MEHLNSFQKQIVNEALIKKNGGLCLPMGSGKTLLSIVIALEQSKNSAEPILIIVSKTLITSWINEIKKFFDDTLSFIVFNTDYSTQLKTDVDIVITTPDCLSKHYKLEEIQNHLKITDEETRAIHYLPSNSYPICKNSPSKLFSTKWSVLLIDELQIYTNVKSVRCEALMSICKKHVWGLSGTMFVEPKVERLLGYYLIIDPDNFPNNLPATKIFVKDRAFKGIQGSIIFRKENEAFKPPKLNNVFVENILTDEERKIYLSMKGTMNQILKKVNEYKKKENVEMARKFSAYLLSMMTILRQNAVSPLLPISSIAVDLADLTTKSEMSQILQQELNKLNITDWLNDPASAKSSRIQKIVECVSSPTNKNKKLIVFSSFRSCLDLIIYFLEELNDRKIFTITSEMNSLKRQQVLDDFKNSENGILTLTYQIGAEGLNLQFCDTVLLVDFWWNSGKTDQAIARVLRYGQMSSCVNVYYFISNTGIEAAIFGKHQDKKEILDQLLTGPALKKIKPLKINEMIVLINAHDNVVAMEKTRL